VAGQFERLDARKHAIGPIVPREPRRPFDRAERRTGDGTPTSSHGPERAESSGDAEQGKAGAEPVAAIGRDAGKLGRPTQSAGGTGGPDRTAAA
jgi:hypothetical protein